MNKNTRPMMERVQKSRDSLKEQNAWAFGVSAKALKGIPTIQEYAYGSEAREKYDVISYDNPKGLPRPVVLYIHGGGWIAGNKESRRFYCAKLAEAGFVVINIEYDLAPERQFPYAIGQCLQAVDYFLDHTAILQVDTARIAVMGESAGAYYAAFVAAASKDPKLPAKLGLPSMRHAEFDVKAMLSNCGAFDFPSMCKSGFPDSDLFMEAFCGINAEEMQTAAGLSKLKKMSPLDWINASYPDTFLMYGSWDFLRNNTFLMQERLLELGVPCQMYKCRGVFYGQHTSNQIFLFPHRAQAILNDVVKYLSDVLKN